MLKKIFVSLLSLFMITASAMAFDFPEPDWGALLNEKTEMVNEVDFELYVEGAVEAAPYFGAKLEPRGGTYFGMVTENSSFLTNVSSYLTYFEMSIDQTDIYYPANEIIRSGDAVVTVAFTINSLDSIDYSKLSVCLENLAAYNKPMIIRFGHEMNVSALGDDPTRYVDVFRHVADMIHKYPNFAVVWSPNDMGALDRPFEYYYPGDGYVDWVGVSSYMKKYFLGNQNTDDKDARYFMTGDYAWATNALKPIIRFMEKNNINKPIMISECGVATENRYGEILDFWATPRFRNLYYNTIMKYPQVKSINYFNTYRGYEVETYHVADSQTPGAVDKEYAKAILNEASVCGAYIKQGESTSEFVFEKADKGSKLTAKNGIVNLYTLAYIPKTPYITVTYKVDGEWYHAADASPYKCGLNVEALSDGAHTVEILTEGLSKIYTFYKSGNVIRFGNEPLPADDIKVMINSEHLQFNDVKPVIIDGRTMVPLRAIFEALGVDVQWNGETKTVVATGRGREVSLTIGVKQIIVNGTATEIDVPAMIIDDRTMVPARAVAQSLGCTVNWLADSRTVVIEG